MTISTRMRFEILRRDGFRCRYCGTKAEEVELHVDHVVPRSLGGTDDADNLAASCQPCNAGKGSIALDSETVDEISAVSADRGQAIRDAVKAIIAEQSLTAADDDPDVQTFIDAWQRWCWGERRNMVVPDARSPEDLLASIRTWKARGMDMESLLELIPIAMNAGQVPIEEKFRYYCGIVWRTIDRAAELAGTDQ